MFNLPIPGAPAPTMPLAFPPIVGIDGLSILLCKKRSVITVDRTRAPHLLPPACSPPGTQKPLWIVEDVIAWLRKNQELPIRNKRGRPRKVPKSRPDSAGREE